MTRLRLFLLAFGLSASFTLAGGGPVLAGSTDQAPINLDDTLATLRVSALTVNAAVSIFIPLLVGLVTKWCTRPYVRGLLDVGFGAVSALVVQATLADGSAVLSEQTFLVWIVGLGASLVAYTKGWKPAGLTSSPIQVPGPTPGTTIMIPGKLA